MHVPHRDYFYHMALIIKVVLSAVKHADNLHLDNQRHVIFFHCGVHATNSQLDSGRWGVKGAAIAPLCKQHVGNVTKWNVGTGICLLFWFLLFSLARLWLFV